MRVIKCEEDYESIIAFFMVSKGEGREFEIYRPGDDGSYSFSSNKEGGFLLAWISVKLNEVTYDVW